MRLYGLIGNPLTHSFSKRYFSGKFEREGLSDYQYELFPLTDITELPELLKQQPFLKGLNVTIPYKKEVIPFLNDSHHLPAGLDACNCIRINQGQLEGFNTDIMGFEHSLRPLLKEQHKQALVLGNGGATTAICYVLKKLGISFSIVSRKLHDNSSFTYDQLDEAVISEHKLIINTTPLGTYPHIDQFPDIPYRYTGNGHLFYDLVYNPAETSFLQKGKAQGAATKNGEEMLMIQAEESWRIWNEF